MSLIQVKFDHNIKQSDIIIPLTNSSHEEAGNAYVNNQPEIQQTSVYGIMSPLIMVNNIVVDFSDVLDFELKCVDVTPTVQMTVLDRYKLITILDTPGVDNELRVQILPRFDNIYKKINLTFFITNFQIRDNYITIKGEYKLPVFFSSNIKSFGEIDTYELYESIAIETGLGFASNIEKSGLDKRWIYCDNKTYSKLLSNEIKRSGYDNQILDYWIDWWNNLVLADIYERYNAIDKDEDMQIWISGQNYEVSEGIEITPQQSVASLNNHPSLKFSELYVKEYKIINNPGSNIYLGTDKIYSIYEMNKTEHMDHMIMDGDVKKDIISHYEYMGEMYGDYNYLLSDRKRSDFLQKIKTNETIEVTINTPLLGLMRGNRVNFLWYINDSRVDGIHSKLNENGVLNNPSTNIPLSSADNIIDKSPDGNFVLDHSISGQYLITGCRMKFSNKMWDYSIVLSRPTSAKPNIIKEYE